MNLKEEDRMIEDVRVALLRVRQERALTYEGLASRIKRVSGERYSAHTVKMFITGNSPGRDWRPFVFDAIRGWGLGTVEFRKRRASG